MIPGDSAQLRWLFEKYNWYKAFGCPIHYDDIYCDEADGIMVIMQRIQECEIEINTKTTRSKVR